MIGGEVEQPRLGLRRRSRGRGRPVAPRGRGGSPRPARAAACRRPARPGSAHAGRGRGRSASPGARPTGWSGWRRRASSRSRTPRCCRRPGAGRRGSGAGPRARPAGPRPGWISSMAAVVSVVSIDHTGASATEPDRSTCASDGGAHPVRVVRDRCHGPIPASTTDSRGPRKRLSTTDSGTSSNSLSSTFSTTAGPQPARRRQPDTQPAFGAWWGCQPAPGTAAKALCLTAPPRVRHCGIGLPHPTKVIGVSRRAQSALLNHRWWLR